MNKARIMSAHNGSFVYAWWEVSSLQSQTALKSYSKEELEHGYSEV